MSESIRERDLPRVSPESTSHVRAVQGGKSVLIPLPEVTNAAALLAEAIEGIKDAAQAEAELILGGLGYLPPVAFGSGLDVDSTRFTVTYDGVTYAPVADEVPFTTTGTFDPDQWRVIQGVTAADLSASLVRYDEYETVEQRLDALASDSGSLLVGFKQAGVDAVARTSEEKLREWVTPEDYGAVGDGVTDDTAAIQKALTVSRVVRFRPGAEYLISSGLVVPSHTTIVAYGSRVIRSGSTNNMVRNYSDGVSGGYSAANNITIMGGTWDTTTGTGNCSCFAFGHAEQIRIIHATMLNENNWHHIEFNACRFAYVDGCRFGGGLATQYQGNEVIQIDAAISSTEFPFFGPYDNTHCQHIYVTNNVFRGVGTGVGTHTPSPTTNHQNIVIEGNVFDDLYYAAVVGLTWSSVTVLNNRIQGAGYGILMNIGTARDNNGIEISGNQMFNLGSSAYGGSTRAIYVAGNANFKAKNVRITNNSIISALGTSQHGIALDFPHNASIIGNNVESVNRSGIFVYGAANGVTVANNTSVSNNVSGEGYESIRLGMLNGSSANRLVVTGNFGDTLRAQYCSNSLITHNNLITSLTHSNNTNTEVSRNIVGGTFS